MNPMASQATKEEINERNRTCNSVCEKRAVFADWKGRKVCPEHWWLSFRWSGGNKWFYFKTTRLYFAKYIK